MKPQHFLPIRISQSSRLITIFFLIIFPGVLTCFGCSHSPGPSGKNNTSGTNQKTTSDEGREEVKNVTDVKFTQIIEERIGQQEVVISWTTESPAPGKITYGLTEAYGESSAPDNEILCTHRMTLKSLRPNTKYHYRIAVETVNGNFLSDDHTFTTPGPLAEDTLIFGICIGYMDVIFKIAGPSVTIQPEAEKVLTQIKKDGFTRLRMMEPFAQAYMRHFPDLSVEAIKLLTDRGFEVLLSLNGSPFINGGKDKESNWIYRYFPGGDLIGKDDDGGLPEHKRRLTTFMDAVKAAGLLPHMQFQLFDEPNSRKYFWGTYEEFEKLLAANIEVLKKPAYGIEDKDILCCAFTSSLSLNSKSEEEGGRQLPYWNFATSYSSNKLVNRFPFSFHWYPSGGISPGAFNYTTEDIKIKPMYPGSYITEMNVTAYMTQGDLMGKKGYTGYRSKNAFRDKVEDVIAYAKRNQVKAIYFFNLKTRTDTPNENGRISTGLFNAAGCPRLEYKQLLQILGRPAQFGPCKDPGNADF